MMSDKPYIWIIIVLVLMTSCFHRSTCPAYYSKYILDEKEIEERYSLFAVDSLPKTGIGHVEKSKFGIIEEKPYKHKYREMKDVPMETIYPEIVDSILMVRNIADSTGADSLGMPTSGPSMQNVNYDQLIYNSLYADLLIEPEEEDLTELLEETGEEDGEIDGEEPQKEKRGFFKRFKKKKEVTIDDPFEDSSEAVPETTPVDDQAEDEDDGF